MHAVACAMLVVTALGAVPRLGFAQRTTSVVRGVVKDQSGAAIPDVEIAAVDAGRTARTDTAGAFTLIGIPGGTARLSVRRLAFEPLSLEFDLAAGDTADVEITLSVVAQKLTGVMVLADATRRSLLQGFYARRKLGVGYFITRADIERRRPITLSEMMRTVPGARLVPTNFGESVLRFARTGRSDCPPQYFIDGVQVWNFNLDDMPPGDVEAIELYAGAAGVPPEYNRMRSNVICGAVIIWSRIPDIDAKP
jgi:hypothetical protein